MSIARHPYGDDAGSGASAGHARRDRAGIRKQGMLRTAVTVTATGLALAVPLSSQAWADLSSAALKSMHLDSAMLKKVRAYDRYRTREADQRQSAKKAVRFARRQIGKPYRWGAEGPDRYDCSGLAMAAWRAAGVRIPRVTYAQYRKVDRKVKLKNLRPGDLVFFHGRRHVGIYVGGGKYLHAPRTGETVRVDKLGKWRRKQFAGAVRPGAPEYREWSPSVKGLVEKIDQMSVQKKADHKPPDKERTPQNLPPIDTASKTDNPPMNPPEHTPAKQATPSEGSAASKPDHSADRAPRSDEQSDKKARSDKKPRSDKKARSDKPTRSIKTASSKTAPSKPKPSKAKQAKQAKPKKSKKSKTAPSKAASSTSASLKPKPPKAAPAESKPAPRPRYETWSATSSDQWWNRSEFLPWAKYVGDLPFEVFAAPGHIAD